MKRSYDEIDRNAKDVDKLWIENAKQDLWSQLREPSVNYLSQVKDDIRSRLDMAFEQRASTSLLVVGPTGSGKKAMIDSVLQSYTHRGASAAVGSSAARNNFIELHDSPGRGRPFK